MTIRFRDPPQYNLTPACPPARYSWLPAPRKIHCHTYEWISLRYLSTTCIGSSKSLGIEFGVQCQCILGAFPESNVSCHSVCHCLHGRPGRHPYFPFFCVHCSRRRLCFTRRRRRKEGGEKKLLFPDSIVPSGFFSRLIRSASDGRTDGRTTEPSPKADSHPLLTVVVLHATITARCSLTC